MEDAERAVIMMGSAAGTTKDAIDRLRAKGEKVGLIKIRLYRPFPADAIAEELKKCADVISGVDMRMQEIRNMMEEEKF